MKNIVILISGRGTNMEAIVHALAAERWPARIAAVISNRPGAAGLEFASSHGVPTAVVDHQGYPDRESFDAQLQRCIDSYAPDLVVLAGFMRVLTPGLVEHYRGRMLNVHPSLLPCFAGLKTHARALEAGVKLHGATIHFVTADLDHGPIVLQAAVPVHAGDTPEALAQRVLEVEHQIYPRAVRWFVEDRLTVDGGLASLTPPEPQWWFATEQA
ncbi:MAG TPA: phosphoribosylglycinamide formyltransferase [Pararobbsia sp.]|nr:phosphoribosylglycinamide formyltransferase [Pararobbsia sp.]